RAMRHAEMLGAHEPVLWRLANALVDQMGTHYTELRQAQPLIEETIELEEIRFRKTLDRGLKLLDEETAELAAGEQLSGAVAFKLYDTYGFPLDLTQDALRGRGISVDTDAFEKAMAKQRADARAAWSGSGETATDAIWYGILERVGASEFLGYEADEAEALVSAIVIDGQEVQSAAPGAEVALLLNQTPFYAESGGQVGDCGVLEGADGARVAIRDTQKLLGELHVHIGELTGGSLRVGDVVKARIDVARRNRIRANHSATHLLHEALRRVLGEHVTQKGSMVGPERLRFDFSHPKPMTAEEIAEVEAIVNRIIRQNTEVSTRLMTPDDAIAAGALALFGEKYGDEVRVVSMGQPVANEHAYSLELCGGTHVKRTGD
ncbi:MAG TPA: alanine--tRNA ligase, partial [Alphaproteobacteria bacterium]|nr:alanine--tRNA ligase [Alphaproteobacteria bacterium]